MNDQTYNAEEIHSLNLKAFVKLMIDRWLLLAGTVLLVSVLTFIISTFLLVPKYQASSYLSVVEPYLQAEFDPRLMINQTLPDTTALPNLAEAKSIKYVAINRAELSEFYREDLPDMNASLQGRNQVKLEVRAENAEHARDLANAWAQVFATRLNEIYGSGDSSITRIEEEVTLAKETWENAQAALQEYLPENRVNELEVQLNYEKRALDLLLNEYYDNQKIIRDSRVNQAQLTAANDGDRLELRYFLSLIALQQRTSGGISGTQFELPAGNIGVEDIQVGDARRSLSELIDSLEDQNQQLISEIDDTKTAIRDITVDLETERHLLEQLSQERDLARSTYQALSNQYEEVRIVQSQSANKAQIAAVADLPQEPISPMITVNVLLAGFLSLIVAISGMLFLDWYRESDN
mgnify:CR=1 FL=1